MTSQWFHLKEKAIRSRKQGLSIRHIETLLHIPKSTLSGWFKNIKLSPSQKSQLERHKLRSLIKARSKAVEWHNNQKAIRIAMAKQEAVATLKRLKDNNGPISELALAMLYLGEGNKSSPTTALGNSNPMILKFFIGVLKQSYGVKNDSIKCELHLRADQSPIGAKRYWSRELGLPLKNFMSVSIDARTRGSATYSSYKGVCVVRCGKAAIQRKLMFLGQLYCEQLIQECH